MATASLTVPLAQTRVRNLTGNPLPLPFPYKGVVYGNAGQQAAYLADSQATVIANLGGSLAITGIWSVEAVPASQAIAVTYHDQSQPPTNGQIASGIGTALASASVLSPTNPVHHVTGTAVITTINPPPWVGPGSYLTLIADGVWGFGASGGNIGCTGTAGATGRALDFVWDPAKGASGTWYPTNS